ITLNRPQRLNAWTPTMGAELAEAFRELDRDRSVRVAVLTGAGRAFCAGADMDFFAAQVAAGGGSLETRQEGDTRADDGKDAGPIAATPNRVEEFPLLMRRLTKPIIAAINGYALGIGCTMTLLCDIRVA